MDTVAILGAGELGATIARMLAGYERARHVALVDPDLGKAKGKALDILQSGPVEGYDTRVTGAAALDEVGVMDALIVADPPGLADQAYTASGAGPVAKALAGPLGKAILLVAGAHAASLVEAAVGVGVPRDRALGSSPVAFAAALRRRLAGELGAEPDEIAVSLFGLPPRYLILPQGSATIGGIAIEKLSATAIRRALEVVRGRTPGPVALAAAALRVLHALQAARGSVLPVVTVLDGEYGHRGAALAVPAKLGGGRVQSVVECALDPVDRVAFDTAAQRRWEGEDS